jgi:hypothetical protein
MPRVVDALGPARSERYLSEVDAVLAPQGGEAEESEGPEDMEDVEAPDQDEEDAFSPARCPPI